MEYLKKDLDKNMCNRYLIKHSKKKHNKKKLILKYGLAKNLKHYLRNYLKVKICITARILIRI